MRPAGFLPKRPPPLDQCAVRLARAAVQHRNLGTRKAVPRTEIVECPGQSRRQEKVCHFFAARFIQTLFAGPAFDDYET